MNYVPYIWGGQTVGKREECIACRECVTKKRLAPQNRASQCGSCSKCGIDCSHLVHNIFTEAGLEYPYASTGTLKRAGKAEVAKFYNMVDVGKDVKSAQPGDLLLYKNHVIMLMHSSPSGRGDFIHATRLGDRKQVGGIFYERDRHLAQFRGKLLKILRHKRFYDFASPPVLSDAFVRKPFSAGLMTSPLGSVLSGPFDDAKQRF